MSCIKIPRDPYSIEHIERKRYLSDDKMKTEWKDETVILTADPEKQVSFAYFINVNDSCLLNLQNSVTREKSSQKCIISALINLLFGIGSEPLNGVRMSSERYREQKIIGKHKHLWRTCQNFC